MRRQQFRALIALNAALLVLLAAVTLAPKVQAQLRSRGEFLMVTGGMNNSKSSGVWIVDTINQELMVVAYDYNTKRLNGIGYRNLMTDAADLTGVRARPGGGP